MTVSLINPKVLLNRPQVKSKACALKNPLSSVVPMPAEVKERKPAAKDGGGETEQMELARTEHVTFSAEIMEPQRPAVGQQSGRGEKARKRKKVKHGLNGAHDTPEAVALSAPVRSTQGPEVRDPVAATKDHSVAAGKNGQPQHGVLKGMKKWLAAYHAERPGADVLQKQIDDFILDYDSRQAKARADREAAATADGWTLVVNKGGRKKTTDADSGITIGAVSSAAAVGKAAKKQKKKTTETTLDFYRFQKREQHRNRIMELQQKFDSDKQRLARLKAARKFTPY